VLLYHFASAGQVKVGIYFLKLMPFDEAVNKSLKRGDSARNAKWESFILVKFTSRFKKPFLQRNQMISGS